jgi:hypothetical protein
LSRASRTASLLAVFVHACGGEDGALAVFPADYAATFQEVRDCRFSLEHDLVQVRVLASPDAFVAYTDRVAPFPIGAIVLKEEYDGSDEACAGPVERFTVMQKLEVGASPSTLDWKWEEAGANRRTIEIDVMACTRCHMDCRQPPEGYDSTCAMP